MKATRFRWQPTSERKFPLSDQRERLQALAQAGAGGDLASAETLAQHHQILEALFTRFSCEAAKWLETGGARGAENAERFMNAAIKAQAAAARCLSALKVLRESPTLPPAPTTPAPTIE